MSREQLEIQAIAAAVAIACALPGVFLVLRRMSLMSDAISHVVLLGIAVGFLAGGTLSSPWLMVGAAATGVLTVTLVEALVRTRLVKRDAAIGLVFPALFSIGVILISRHAGDVHLDTDAVLLGELAFAPLDRLKLLGIDMPRTLWVMGGILILNFSFIALFYKELKLATFDPGLAAALGFVPGAIHYGLMTLVSVTAVGAFDAVGSILVVALMIVPAATAYLLTDRLSVMIGLSAAIGVAGAAAGYWTAHVLDASIAGCMATVLGLLFVGALVLAPRRGLAVRAARRRRQRYEFAQSMLIVHLMHHEGAPEEARECRVVHLGEHFRWRLSFASAVARHAEHQGYVTKQDGRLSLTPSGRAAAREAVVA